MRLSARTAESEPSHGRKNLAGRDSSSGQPSPNQDDPVMRANRSRDSGSTPAEIIHPCEGLPARRPGVQGLVGLRVKVDEENEEAGRDPSPGSIKPLTQSVENEE